MMRLAIVGHGRMGRMVEQLAPEYGFEVGLILDVHNNTAYEGLTAANFEGIDAAVEFSLPASAVENIERLAALGINTVTGTTGWHNQMERVREFVERHGTGLVWSANYSIGMNVFFRLAAEAARLLAEQPDYGAWGWEIHHDTKQDAPSGTLLQLVERMKRAGYSRPIDVSANRAGRHPGTHEIGFDSAADTISLRHVTRNREGFARGALHAARWLQGRKGVHEFGDILFAS